MPKTDNVRQVDLPRATGGGSVYIRGGGAGGVSNADTVDGYHASSTPTAGKLLALDASAQFDPSVIEWADVAGAGLSASGDTLVVRWGSSPTTIVPDAATAGGSATTSARSDHTHAIACAAPTTNLSVTSANAEGSATSFARSDHSHAITSSANPGAAASILASSAQGYLQLVRLGLGVAPSYPLQVQGTTPQLRLQQDAGNYADFEVAGDGDLTIQPSGDSLLVPSGKTLASANWVSQTTGWGIYPESTHGRDGYADFRYIYADELHVKAFIADLEQALAGGQIISKSVAILATDFTVPAKGDGAFLTVEDLPGTTAYVFANNDWIRIRNISRSGGGLVVADAYGTVTQVSQNGDGTQTYTFTRAAADTGSAVAGTVVQKGGLVLDYGVSGNGYWEVTTLDPAGSPYAQVATWETHPQNLTVHARLGNLDGIAGIGAEWGLWAGKDSNHWIKVSDAGAEIKGLKQTWIDAGGNTRGQVDPTATGSNYLFWLGPSSGDKRFGVTADGTVYIGNVPSSNIAGWAHASDLTKIDGGKIRAGSIVLSGLDPGGQLAGQNLLMNSSFTEDSNGDGIPDNWSFRYGFSGTGVVVTISGDTYVYDSLSIKLEGTRNSAEGGYLEASSHMVAVHSSFGPGKKFAAGIWLYKSVDSGAADYSELLLRALDSGGGYITDFGSTVTTTPISQWTYLWCSGTAPAGTVYINVLLRHHQTNNGETARIYLDGATLSVGEYPIAWSAAQRGTVFIDGSKVRVGTRNGTRVEINAEGVGGYSDRTTKQFWLDAATGRGMFGGGKGRLDASGLSLLGSPSFANESSVRFLNSAGSALQGAVYAFSDRMVLQAPGSEGVHVMATTVAGQWNKLTCASVSLMGDVSLSRPLTGVMQLSADKVGIGTSSPEAQFHVHGAGSVSYTSGMGSYHHYNLLGYTEGTRWWYLGRINTAAGTTGGGESGYVDIEMHDGRDIGLRSGSGTRLIAVARSEAITWEFVHFGATGPTAAQRSYFACYRDASNNFHLYLLQASYAAVTITVNKTMRTFQEPVLQSPSGTLVHHTHQNGNLAHWMGALDVNGVTRTAGICTDLDAYDAGAYVWGLGGVVTTGDVGANRLVGVRINGTWYHLLARTT